MKGLIAILGSEKVEKVQQFLQKKQISGFCFGFEKIPKQTKSLFKKLSIDYEENHHSIDKIIKAEKIIKSPGIDQKSDLIVEIKKNRNDIYPRLSLGFLKLIQKS